ARVALLLHFFMFLMSRELSCVGETELPLPANSFVFTLENATASEMSRVLN
ncbi:unnamed protein product, partial [Ceratitis capitata]